MDTASKVASHLLDLIAGTVTGNQFARISIPVATIQALGFATGALLCALIGAMQWQSDRDTRQRARRPQGIRDWSHARFPRNLTV